MPDTHVIKPVVNPLDVAVRVGTCCGGVELGVSVGTMGIVVLLDEKAAQLVALAIDAALLRLMLGESREDEDEPDYGWLEG